MWNSTAVGHAPFRPFRPYKKPSSNVSAMLVKQAWHRSQAAWSPEQPHQPWTAECTQRPQCCSAARSPSCTPGQLGVARHVFVQPTMHIKHLSRQYAPEVLTFDFSVHPRNVDLACCQVPHLRAWAAGGDKVQICKGKPALVHSCHSEPPLVLPGCSLKLQQVTCKQRTILVTCKKRSCKQTGDLQAERITGDLQQSTSPVSAQELWISSALTRLHPKAAGFESQNLACRAIT